VLLKSDLDVQQTYPSKMRERKRRKKVKDWVDGKKPNRILHFKFEFKSKLFHSFRLPKKPGIKTVYSSSLAERLNKFV